MGFPISHVGEVDFLLFFFVGRVARYTRDGQRMVDRSYF